MEKFEEPCRMSEIPDHAPATVSIENQMPLDLFDAMREFIRCHPQWDQYRLMQAALAGFLFQKVARIVLWRGTIWMGCFVETRKVKSHHLQSHRCKRSRCKPGQCKPVRWKRGRWKREGPTPIPRSTNLRALHYPVGNPANRQHRVHGSKRCLRQIIFPAAVMSFFAESVVVAIGS